MFVNYLDLADKSGKILSLLTALVACKLQIISDSYYSERKTEIIFSIPGL